MLTTSKLETIDPGFEREHVLLSTVDLRNGNYRPNSVKPRSRKCWIVCVPFPGSVPPVPRR